MTGVHVAGIGIVEFGVHTGESVVELGQRAARAALADAGLGYDDVGEVFCASMLSPPQTALRVAHGLGRTAIPVTAVESASAGGLVALRHAVTAVSAGHCDVALAIGYEKLTELTPGGVVPRPSSPWDLFVPHIHYAIEAARWLHDHGGGPEVLAAAAATTWNQARRTPHAARRADADVTTEEVLAAKMVATPLTRMMCHVACDGAAAVVVTRQTDTRTVAVASLAQTSQPADPSWPVDGPVVGPPSQTTVTAQRALAAAGIVPGDVDVVNVHDMVVSEQLTTVVAAGLVSPDEAVELARTGGLGSSGRLPVNTDGGCIARGHPIGATGLAQAAEVVVQLRGEAGDRQVDGARIGLVHAAGGGGSCAVGVLTA